MKQLPKTIYHYTSSKGLHGILSSGVLYFTDSLFLNDRNERKNFYLLLEEYLKTWNQGQRDILLQRYFRPPDYITRCLEKTDPAQEDATRYFVLSCSEEKDSLPMWNYYTRSANAAGYNIHFEANSLIKQLKSHPVLKQLKTGTQSLMCRRVVYDEEIKRKALQQVLKRFSHQWERAESGKEQSRLLSALDRKFEAMSLFYKDRAFAHEGEIRIVIPSCNRKIHRLTGSKENQPYRFRQVRGAQTPYLALDVLEKGKAITGVTAGPALDKETAVKGVEYMLYFYGFPQTCKVSAVPLRY